MPQLLPCCNKQNVPHLICWYSCRHEGGQLTQKNGLCEEVNKEAAADIAFTVFERYDLDRSQTINSLEEAQQITTNLLYKLGVSVSARESDKELHALKNVATNPMAFDDYWDWFWATFVSNRA